MFLKIRNHDVNRSEGSANKTILINVNDIIKINQSGDGTAEITITNKMSSGVFETIRITPLEFSTMVDILDYNGMIFKDLSLKEERTELKRIEELKIAKKKLENELSGKKEDSPQKTFLEKIGVSTPKIVRDDVEF